MQLTENIEITIITAIMSLISAIITGTFAFLAQKRAGEARDHAARASLEVTNYHPTNLRDDLDYHFNDLDHRFDSSDAHLAEYLKTADRTAHRFEELESDMRSIRLEIGHVIDMATAATERISNLETKHSTQPE